MWFIVLGVVYCYWVWSILSIVFSNNEWTVTDNILDSDYMKNTARYNKLILDRLAVCRREQQQQQQQLVIGREDKQQLLEERDSEVLCD